MRKTLTLLIIGCLLAACGDGVFGAAASTSTSPSINTTTSSTAATTSSTTTTGASSTTLADGGAFAAEAGTPPGELDSFTGTSEMYLSLDAGGAVVTTDAVYVGDAYQCTSTMENMGFSVTMTVVATPETVWVGQGGSFEESDFSDPNVQGVTAICAASPAFWSGFGETSCATAPGDPDEVNGIPTQRIDLSGALGCMDWVDLAAAFGYGSFPESAEFNEVVFWIADPGGWPVEVQARMHLSEEAVTELLGVTGLGTGLIDLRIQIDNINDPSLSVQVPPP